MAVNAGMPTTIREPNVVMSRPALSISVTTFHVMRSAAVSIVRDSTVPDR